MTLTPEQAIGAAKNIKRWMTVNPRYDTPEARLQMADFVHMARLLNHKQIRDRRAAQA
jgi:hypothetical protein